MIQREVESTMIGMERMQLVNAKSGLVGKMILHEEKMTLPGRLTVKYPFVSNVSSFYIEETGGKWYNTRKKGL